MLYLKYFAATKHIEKKENEEKIKRYVGSREKRRDIPFLHPNEKKKQKNKEEDYVWELKKMMMCLPLCPRRTAT